MNINAYRPGSNNEGLFDSIVTIENYPLDNRRAKKIRQLSISSYSRFEMTHYDLTVLVSIFKDIEVNFSYRIELFDKETIKRLAGHFVFLLHELIENPGKSPVEIEIISGEEKRRLLFDFNCTRADFSRDRTLYQLFEQQGELIPEGIAVIGMTHGVQRTAKGVGTRFIASDPGEQNVHLTYNRLNNASNQVDTIPINDPAVFSSSAKIHLHLPPAPVTCLAYIIYTSGSTGQPKGVMVDHAAIVNTLYALEQMYPFAPTDVYLMKTPYLFDVSLTELFGWFCGNKGGRLALLEPGGEKDPGKILDTIEKMHVTHINFVPSMFDPFLNLLTPGNIRKLSGLKYIFLSGEALSPELVKRFRDLNDCILLEDLYGPIEAAIYTSRYSLAEWTGSSNIPIGKPTPNVRLYILDLYHGLQPVGIPGELVIAGLGLARGYLNNPELTAEKFCLRRPGGRRMAHGALRTASNALFALRPAHCALRGAPRKNFLLSGSHKDHMQPCSYLLSFHPITPSSEPVTRSVGSLTATSNS